MLILTVTYFIEDNNSIDSKSIGRFMTEFSVTNESRVFLITFSILVRRLKDDRALDYLMINFKLSAK